MFASLKKGLDRWAINAACSTVSFHGVANDFSRLEPLFRAPSLAPPDSGAKGSLSFSTDQDFTFPSPLPGRSPENNSVPGKLWMAGPHWREKPIVFLVHGWNGEAAYQYLFPWLARRLAKYGINTAMIELPYHGQRKPRSPGALRNFISDDLGELLRATQQSLADFAYLEAWARSQGCQSIGLWGFSLGGWLAALLSSVRTGFSFMALTTPICRLERVVNELAFCAPICQAMKSTPLPLDAFNLKINLPQIAKDRILIIKSEYDLFVPPETVEEVWHAWNYPEIRRLPHSHLSVLLSLSTSLRTIRWIQRIAGRNQHTELGALNDGSARR